MLVSELIDRTYSNWLEPAGINRPTFDVLREALGGSVADLTVKVEGRVSNIPRDSLLEIEEELILTEEVVGNDITAHERGFRETAVTAHALNTRVYIDPPFPRKVVLNTLTDVIGSLYPLGLYRRGTVEVEVDALQTANLPSGAKFLISAIVADSGSNETYHRLSRAHEDFLEYREFDPPKVRLFAPHGADATLVYARDFTPPTTTAQDLTADLGVSANLAPHLAQAIAGRLLQTRELPRVQIEEIRRFLGSQGIQVGAALNVGQALIQDFEGRHVGAERRRLHDLDPLQMEWVYPR